jgi:hypothetical protein
MRHAWRPLLLLAVLLSPALTVAQPEGNQNPAGQNTPDRAGPAAGPETVREERTVFVPYSQLEGVLGPEGRAVVVPYEQFLQLWEALSQAPKEKEAPPPVDAALSSARYEGHVDGGLASFRGTWSVSVLTERYARLALPFSGVAVSKALLDGKPALMTASDAGLELLVRGRGEHALEIDFSAPVRLDGPKSTLRLGLPPVAVAALELTLPATSLELVAAQGGPESIREERGSTIAQLALGGLSSLDLSWRQKAAAIAPEKAAIFVTSLQVLSVGPSAIHSHVTLDFQVTQSTADALVLGLPEGFTPLAVQLPGLRRQSLEGRSLRLELEAPVQGPVQIVLDGEQPLEGPGAGKPVTAPLVRAQGVEREQSYVALLEPEGLKLTASAEGLAEVDPSELPRQPEGEQRVLQSFVYTAYPGRAAGGPPAQRLTLGIERLEPEVQTEAQTLLTISEDHVAVQIFLTHELRRAGLFSMRYRIPDGLRIDEVGPEDQVRSFRVRPAEPADGQPAAGEQVLEVELSGRAEKQLELEVSGEMERASEAAPVAIPQIRTLGAVREQGVVGVALDPSFDVRMGESGGLYPMNVRELPEERFPQEGAEPTALAYRYNALPYSGQLVIERKRPKVTAEVAHRIIVTEDQLKVDSTVSYTILYAGISELSIEVPEEAGSFVDIEGADIKEKSRVPGSEKGTVRWRVVLQRSVLGSYSLGVRFDQGMKEIPVGRAQMVAVPAIRVLDVARDQGTIAIGKRPNLEVEPVPTDLEPLDPKELPEAARAQDVFLAYRYLKQPYALNLKILRHEYEAVLTTIVNRMHLETVLSREGLATTEMLLEVQNNQRQYLELRLPGGSGADGSRILSLFVAGKAVRPAHREDGTTMVRMIQSAASDQAFFIRMVYETRLAELGVLPQGHALDAPALLDVPVSRTTWRVYLPFGYRHTSFGGNVEPVQPWSQGWAEAMAMLTQEVHAPSLGVDRETVAPEDVHLDASKPRIPEKEGGAAGVLPIDVSLAAEGQSLSFSKLGGGARLEFSSMPNGLYYGLHFALLCLVVAGCVTAPRRIYWAFRVSTGKAALACIAAPVLLSPFTPMALRDALDMVFAGGLLTGLGIVAVSIVRRSGRGGEAVARGLAALRKGLADRFRGRGWKPLEDSPAAQDQASKAAEAKDPAHRADPEEKR